MPEHDVECGNRCAAMRLEEARCQEMVFEPDQSMHEAVGFPLGAAPKMAQDAGARLLTGEQAET